MNRSAFIKDESMTMLARKHLELFCNQDEKIIAVNVFKRDGIEGYLGSFIRGAFEVCLLKGDPDKQEISVVDVPDSSTLFLMIDFIREKALDKGRRARIFYRKDAALSDTYLSIAWSLCLDHNYRVLLHKGRDFNRNMIEIYPVGATFTVEEKFGRNRWLLMVADSE